MAGTLTEEQYQQQQLNRQQKMAELLMAQGSQGQPAGQMVSGRYVPNSWAQNLVPVAQMLTGAYLGKKGDEESLKLAEQLRGKQQQEMENYLKLYQGTPATYGADIPTETYENVKGQMLTPAVPANPQAANMYGLGTRYNPELKQVALKKLTEGPNLKEMSLIDPATGNKIIGTYDANNPNPRSTWQPWGTSSEGIGRAEILHLRDKGIPVPQANVNYNQVGIQPQGQPQGQPSVVPVGQNQSTVKPVSATNVKENDLVKVYGYDPFKPPPMPAMPSSSHAREWQANLSKPLEGTPANIVTGATTYADALENYKNYINKLSAKDLANPQIRNRLDSLYATVKLTGKEANNLGVLNGGDERILEEVVPNYKNITVTKETVNKILEEQKQFGSSKIVSTYRTAQKPVPENMRKYVVIPKVEQQTEQNAPSQPNVTAKATLNGRQIEVRNGKWVDSKTGQEVK